MKHPDPKRITELAEKIEAQGDITEQEADSIRSLFSQNCAKTKLNSKSARFDSGLLDSLNGFIKLVLDLTKQGKSGVFISSFPVCPPYYVHPELKEPLQNIIENLSPKDRAAIFNISLNPLRDGEEIVNGINVFENTSSDRWVLMDYSIHHSSSLYGFCPRCLGAFRRDGLKKAFENYADISVVSDPLHYLAAGFYFDYSGYNIICSEDILSDAVVSFINSKHIPFLVYGSMSLFWNKYMNERIAVESELARRITEAVRKSGKDIIEEMKNEGLIYHSKSTADIYFDYLKQSYKAIIRGSKNKGIFRLVNKGFNAEEWYRFNDYHRMIDFARNLLNEILKYGKMIDRAREEEAEEDVWVLR